MFIRQFAKKRRILYGMLAYSLSLLLGCTVQPLGAPAPLLSALPAAKPQTQQLTFIRNQHRRELLGVLRHDETSLRLALLSPQGQRLLTLVHDAQSARFLPDAQFEPPFSADWLANRLYWSLWPSSSLSQAFMDSGWKLEEHYEERLIRYHGQIITRITGSSECRIIDDIEGGYRLYIAPVNVENDRIDNTCPAN